MGFTLRIATALVLTLWGSFRNVVMFYFTCVPSWMVLCAPLCNAFVSQLSFSSKLQLGKRKKSSRLSPSRLIARSQRCSLPYSSSHVATANGVRWEIESGRNRQMKGGENNCPSLSLTHLLWEWEREGVTYHHLLSVSSRDGWNRFKTTGNSSSWTPQ